MAAIDLMRCVFRAMRDDPDLMGEALRAAVFVGGTGAYTTFDLIDGFEPVTPNEGVFSAMWGRKPADSGDLAELDRITAFWSASLGLLVAWWWDGDGQLYFSAPDWGLAVSNSDCKCDYGWVSAAVFAPEISKPEAA